MTINQKLKSKVRIKSKRYSSLEGCPQKKGVCLSVTKQAPKRPNSANRSVAKIKLSNKKIISAYITGQSHNIQEHSYVLVRGGKVQDLPGIRYKIIRGVFDASSDDTKKRSRSRYGAKKQNK